MEKPDYSSLPKEQLEYLGMLDKDGNLKEEEVSSATQISAVEPHATVCTMNPIDSLKKDIEKKVKIKDDGDEKKLKINKIKEKIKKESFRTIKNVSLKEKAIDGVKSVMKNADCQSKSLFDCFADWRLLKDEGFSVELVDEDDGVEEFVVMDEKGNELIIRNYCDEKIIRFEENYVRSEKPEQGLKNHYVIFNDYTGTNFDSICSGIKQRILYFIEECLNEGSEVDVYTESDVSEDEPEDMSEVEEDYKKKKLKKESKIKGHSLKMRLPTKFVRR